MGKSKNKKKESKTAGQDSNAKFKQPGQNSSAKKKK